MSALTATINLLDAERVLLFSLSRERTLTFEHRSLDDGSVARSKSNPAGSNTYRLRSLSDIVSLNIDSMVWTSSCLVCSLVESPRSPENQIHVYGVMEGDNHITLLSPIHKALDNITAESGRLAGCSNGDEAWLYHQAFDPPSGKRFIFEKRLGNRHSEDRVLIDTESALEGSALSAFFDGRDQWLVWQEQDSSISIQNLKTRARYRVKDALVTKPTSLAATLVSTKTDARDVLHIYFTGGRDELYRASLILEANAIADITQLEGNKTVVHGSQIAAISDPTRRRSVVYFHENLDKINAAYGDWDN